MSVSFDLVVAYTRMMGIGNNGTLPWPRLSKDMAHFVDKTKTAPEGMVNAVIMGRKTWDSIPLALRPLKGRYNIVITSQGDITYVFFPLPVDFALYSNTILCFVYIASHVFGFKCLSFPFKLTTS